MPGTTRTIYNGQAVYWVENSGSLALFPWTGASQIIAGISTSPDTTFNISGPYPNIAFQSEGVFTVSGATFTVGAPVYLASDGRPTQGPLYGQPTVNPTGVEIGVALSATDILLNLQHAVPRGTAAGVDIQALAVSNANPYPHVPTSGEVVGFKQYIGLGSAPSAFSPSQNGELVVEATSNTTLTFKFKGSDGTVRSATLTLS